MYQEPARWMKPNGIAVLPPVVNKTDVFCILEYKRMSDVTDQYLLRVKSTVENQYGSLRSSLSDTIIVHHQGWKVERVVEQISFVTGLRSVNEQDLKKTLTRESEFFMKLRCFRRYQD